MWSPRESLKENLWLILSINYLLEFSSTSQTLIYLCKETQNISCEMPNAFKRVLNMNVNYEININIYILSYWNYIFIFDPYVYLSSIYLHNIRIFSRGVYIYIYIYEITYIHKHTHIHTHVRSVISHVMF